jgi:hypothetical protein
MHRPLPILTFCFAVRRAAATRVVAALALIAVVGAVTPVYAGNGPVPGPPSDDGTQSVVLPGDPTCGRDTTQFTVKPFTTGTFHDGIWVTIDAAITKDGHVFGWKSNIGVDVVIVKGARNVNLYVYDPEDTADTGLHAPMNTANQSFFDVRHILFCYDNDAPPPTAPPTALPTTAPPAQASPTWATPAPAVRGQARLTG